MIVEIEALPYCRDPTLLEAVAAWGAAIVTRRMQFNGPFCRLTAARMTPSCSQKKERHDSKTARARL
jgi:hypothetical protein